MKVTILLNHGVTVDFEMSVEDVLKWADTIYHGGYVTGPSVEGAGYLIPTTSIAALVVPDVADLAAVQEFAESVPVVEASK